MTRRPLPDLPGATFLDAFVNPVREEVYYWHGSELIALDLTCRTERALFEVPHGYNSGQITCTADGAFICAPFVEDYSDRITLDLLHGYVGFAELSAARPHSQIMKIATDGSGAQVVWEEDYWVGHVNASPTHPHLLSFCHEGPWNKVDQRIWGLNLESGEAWKIRPTRPGDMVGHEYWLADGESLGYHGKFGGHALFGFTRYDNSERQEAALYVDSNHFHSNSRHLIVGDGIGSKTPYILLWRWPTRGGQIEAPRILCRHDGSRHMQQLHIHPRLTPDGKAVLFTSDKSGYGQLYCVELPEDLNSLPKLEE
jgi:oligogalacturonide lyase